MNDQIDEREFDYLSVIARDNSAEQVERYLSFGAEIVEQLFSKNGGAYVVVQIESQHSKWLEARLGSGLIGAQVHKTSDEALDRLYEMREHFGDEPTEDEQTAAAIHETADMPGETTVMVIGEIAQVGALPRRGIYKEAEVAIPAITRVTWQGGRTLGEAHDEARRIFFDALDAGDRRCVVKIADSKHLDVSEKADAIAGFLIALGYEVAR